jgi:thiol-disulfide isomerase/thioredoxin
MKKIISLLLLVVLAISSQTNAGAQALNIQAQFNQLPSGTSKVIFEYMNGQEWKQIDNKALDKEGKVSFQFIPPVYGQYRFRFPSGKTSVIWSDFIISSYKNEPMSMDFVINYPDMNGRPISVSNSLESQLYLELMNAYLDFDALRTAVPVEQDKLEKATTLLNQISRRMAQQNKGTFTGDVVADLVYQPVRSDYPKEKHESLNDSLFYIKFGISKLPYYKAGALHHNLFVRSLERYFKHMQQKDSDDYAIDFIDGVMFRSGGLEEVDQFLFKYLLDKMLGYKSEKGLSHLLSHYSQDCSEDHSSKSANDQLVNALNEVAPGKKVWPLKLPDINATPVSLQDVCKKNKMTLMLFWKSSCNHCEEFKPVLRGLYDQYHSKGLEVYAVSIDKDINEWKTYVNAHPQPWKDTFLAYDVRKEFNNHYPVPSTPTLIALDQNGKVISRLIVRSKMEEFLKENFK